MLTLGRRTVSVFAALMLGSIASKSAAQQTYPQTLYWGAGLVDIPVAWVAPLTGDFALNYSVKRFERGDANTKINYDDQLNSQLTFSMSAFGRIEAGVAFFSANPEQGFFGQGLILNEESFRQRGGAARWIPSVAVGVRNVGPFKRIDRFGAGYDLLPPEPGSPNYRHVADDLHRGFDTQNTVYGVVTKGFSLSEIRSGWPDLGLSASVGYGNGLFEDDNDLGDLYSKHSTGGLFGGLKVDFQPARLTTISLMAEHNAWDINLGGSVDYRGIRGGIYLTELGGGSADRTDTTGAGLLYNYSKVAFTLGFQSNIFALLRGDFLRGRVAELERRREGLLAEINARQQRITALELEINRYEAQNLLELEQRRAEAEAQLREEREALRRLEERLKVLEGQQPTPPRPPSR